MKTMFSYTRFLTRARKIKVPVTVGFSLFGVEIINENHDKVDPTSKTAKELSEVVSRSIQEETGWDRVKAAFKTNDFGELSTELENAMHAGYAGLLAGGFIGAIASSKDAYTEFLDKNKATVFESHFQAKKALQHKVTLAMAHGGFKVGWRVGLFMSSFVLFTSLIAAYRNKSSVLEYSLGGASAGAMYKMRMGPKAMVAGGLAGMGLGTIAGCVTVGLMKLSGTTAEEIRFYRHDWKTAPRREIDGAENGAPGHLRLVEKGNEEASQAGKN